MQLFSDPEACNPDKQNAEVMICNSLSCGEVDQQSLQCDYNATFQESANELFLIS